jgi:hypothetical protein
VLRGVSSAPLTQRRKARPNWPKGMPKGGRCFGLCASCLLLTASRTSHGLPTLQAYKAATHTRPSTVRTHGTPLGSYVDGHLWCADEKSNEKCSCQYVWGSDEVPQMKSRIG